MLAYLNESVIQNERGDSEKDGERQKDKRGEKTKTERNRAEFLQGLKLNRPTSLAIFLPPYDEYMYIHNFDLMITSV